MLNAATHPAPPTITGPTYEPTATCPVCGLAAAIDWTEGEPLWSETNGGTEPPCAHVTLDGMQAAADVWADEQRDAAVQL